MRADLLPRSQTQPVFTPAISHAGGVSERTRRSMVTRPGPALMLPHARPARVVEEAVRALREHAPRQHLQQRRRPLVRWEERHV
eukprot:1478454-Prymnesium_polylepis.1